MVKVSLQLAVLKCRNKGSSTCKEAGAPKGSWANDYWATSKESQEGSHEETMQL